MWLFTTLLLQTALAQNEISFQPTREFRKIGAAVIDEGRLTKEVIPDITFTDPNGYSIEYHLLRGESRQMPSDLEASYKDLEFDSTSWRWNKKEVIYRFPIRLPDSEPEYSTGRRVKNVAILYARNEKGSNAPTRVRTTVVTYNLNDLKAFTRFEITLKVENRVDLQDTIRRMVELVTAQTGTNLNQWRVIEVSRADSDQYKVSLTLNDDRSDVKCDDQNLAIEWSKLTDLSDFASASVANSFSKKFENAALAENVELVTIRTVNGDGCAMPPPPPEPKPPKKDLPEGPIIINFSSGKDQTLDLTDNGAVDFDSFEIVSSDLNVDYRRFMKVDGTTIKLAIPTQFRSFAITVNVGGVGNLEYQFTEAFDISEAPAYTIKLEVAYPTEWTYETSAVALKRLETAASQGFVWYGLEGNTIELGIPENLSKCNDLVNSVEWLELSSDGEITIIPAELVGFEEDFKLGYNVETNCVVEITSTTTTTTSTTTEPETSTTTTTQASTTSTTTKPKPRCHALFKSAKSKKKTIEVKYNTLEVFKADRIFEMVNSRQKKGGAKLEIVSVQPATTGITQYENNELTIFATDFAISERIQTISGTTNKGVTLTIRLANKAPDCENDEQEIELDIVPQKRPAVAGCDISQSNTHNHEFEVIMKKNKSLAQSINDEYKIMRIIQETYNDKDMSQIYMIRCDETDQNGDKGYKMVWGNATLYNCDKVCPRDEIHTLTNKLVTPSSDDKNGKTWVVEAKFHAKFKDASFELTTVSARGIHACQQDAGGAKKQEGPEVAEAGSNKKVVVLIVLTIGALAVIVGCCWMRQKKNNEHSQGTIRKSNVPVIMGDEGLGDNEQGKLLENSRANGTVERSKEELPPSPEPPVKSEVPTITVDKVADTHELDNKSTVRIYLREKNGKSLL